MPSRTFRLTASSARLVGGVTLALLIFGATTAPALAVADTTPGAYTDVYSVTSGSAAGVTLNLLANDLYPGGTTNANLSVTQIAGTTLTPGTAQSIAVTGGTVNVAADGAMTFVPGTTSLDTVNFTYTVKYSTTGTTSTGNVKIFVLAAALTADTSSGAVGVTQTGNVWSNDNAVTTARSGLTISTYAIAGVAGTFAAGTTKTIAGVGDITLQSNGDWTFVPLASYSGAVPQLTYSASKSVSTTGYLTGVDDNNVPLSKSTFGASGPYYADPHYWLVSALQYGTTTLLSTTSPVRTTPVTQSHPWFNALPNPSITAQGGTSPSSQSQLGTYTFGTAFTLPVTADLSTATVVMKMGADDYGVVRLNANGATVAVTANPGSVPYTSLSSLSANTIPVANLVPGLNSLTLTVTNSTVLFALYVGQFDISYTDKRSSTLDITVISPTSVSGSTTPLAVPLGGTGVLAAMTTLLALVAGRQLRGHCSK